MTLLSNIFSLLRELILYQEVLIQLFLRDLKIRYKNTVFGYIWSLLNPILQLSITTLIFSHLVKWEMNHYLLYLFSGLLAWNFFSISTITAASSFIENEAFIRKIYLPKILFPLTKVLLRFVDFLICFSLLGIAGMVLGYPIQLPLLGLPAAIFLLFLFTVGVAILAATITVFFRDFQYLLSVFLQLFQLLTPVLYPIQIIPPSYQWILKLNPLYYEIELFHQLVYQGIFPSLQDWSLAFGISLFVFSLSLIVLFRIKNHLVFWL